MLFRGIALLLCFSVLNACSTFSTVANSGGDRPFHVYAGDKVRVFTNDDESHVFKITEVTDESLKGEKIEVFFKDIEEIEVKEIDGTKLGLGLGAASLVGFLALLAIGVSAGGMSF